MESHLTQQICLTMLMYLVPMKRLALRTQYSGVWADILSASSSLGPFEQSLPIGLNSSSEDIINVSKWPVGRSSKLFYSCSFTDQNDFQLLFWRANLNHGSKGKKHLANLWANCMQLPYFTISSTKKQHSVINRACWDMECTNLHKGSEKLMNHNWY